MRSTALDKTNTQHNHSKPIPFNSTNAPNDRRRIRSITIVEAFQPKNSFAMRDVLRTSLNDFKNEATAMANETLPKSSAPKYLPDRIKRKNKKTVEKEETAEFKVFLMRDFC